jgi:hypothetical protein
MASHAAIFPAPPDRGNARTSSPGDFTDKVIFRRCLACDRLNIVRDSHFACAVCDSTLPMHWNISAA